MRLKDYNEKDGKRVWLSAGDHDSELAQFIDQAQSPEQELAFLLGGRVGLRRKEIINITPNDIVDGPTGKHVRVWSDYAKREKYREPPIPENVENIANTLAYEQEPDEALVDVDDSTVYRWVKRAADRMRAGTGDEGWKFLDVHDLRRTWGTYLLEQGVLPAVVMEWGGWEDWKTFRDHYLSEFSPEAIKRERGKVSYLGEGTNDFSDSHVVPVANSPRSGGDYDVR